MVEILKKNLGKLGGGSPLNTPLMLATTATSAYDDNQSQWQQTKNDDDDVTMKSC